MRRHVGGLVLCVLLVACTSDHDSAAPTPSPTASPSASPSPAATTFDVPTNQYELGMVWPTAALSGTLRVVVRSGTTCFVVVDAGHRYSVTWPKGFRGDSSQPRPRLLAPDGSTVAEVGDQLVVGGGMGRGTGACNRGRQAFAAGPIEVNGKPGYGPRA
jgi:hypothetical protein